LRESSLLWQKHLTGILTRCGFQSVPHEPYSFINKGIVIFFYVDDIVIAYREPSKKVADEVTKMLKSTYSL
jgi:hypothetical protein